MWLAEYQYRGGGTQGERAANARIGATFANTTTQTIGALQNRGRQAIASGRAIEQGSDPRTITNLPVATSSRTVERGRSAPFQRYQYVGEVAVDVRMADGRTIPKTATVHIGSDRPLTNEEVKRRIEERALMKAEHWVTGSTPPCGDPETMNVSRVSVTAAFEQR